MTIDDEIAWWTKEMNAAKKQELAMVCFGVATGLKLAKADYLPSGPSPTHSPIVNPTR